MSSVCRSSVENSTFGISTTTRYRPLSHIPPVLSFFKYLSSTSHAIALKEHVCIVV